MRGWHLPLLPLAAVGLVILAAIAPATDASSDRPYLLAPATDEYARHDPKGTTIIPNGRFLRPLGASVPVAKWPQAVVLTPDGTQVFVASDGAAQIISRWRDSAPEVLPVGLPTPTGGRKPPTSGGVAVSADGKRLYWGAGDLGSVYVFDLPARKLVGEIPLNGEVGGRKWEDSFVMDVALSADGRHLYCADVTNFRLAIADTQSLKVIASTPVGRYPYALSVVGSRVYVANIGLFEYSPIPPPASTRWDKRGLTFPAFGFPSKEAEEGVEFEGRRVPGLGKPNVAESFSVWGVDVSAPDTPKIVSRVKTGLLMGQPTERGKTFGGSAPNYLVARGDSLWVSNGNNDLIERIDLRSHRIAARRRLVAAPLVKDLRGVSPSGMALSPDGRRLYVAESGLNAIAVLDARSLEVKGHLPTAWYPYRVAVSPDGGHLLVTCFKGFGNGPSGGAKPDSPYLGMKGVLTVVPLPADRELGRHTKTVLECNGLVDRRAERTALTSPVIPYTPGQESEQIKYVVFITKENHTYDTVFDRIPGAKHDPSLLRWGLRQNIVHPGQPSLTDVPVMVNHNALAREFAVSDNFYMEPEASGVGHRWLIGIQPNNLCQMTYTVGWNFKVNSTAPGRRYSFGSNGSMQPEDYPEAGAMWEHLHRSGIPFRNYGEGFEFAGVDEGEGNGMTGAREVVNFPMPMALYNSTCREFPIYNTNIPDQYRADWFIRDYQRNIASGKMAMPRFLNIAICNDHGSTPNAAKGYPYLASWMADNDLALGRIVEFLSRTPYWKNMAIFVTQDDAGGEPDHVDAQRSVLLVISPWAKRRHVSHRHTTITSMHRTLYQVLGLPPLNLWDALASDFSDAFTTTPDFTPYTVRPVDPRIFDPAKAKDKNDPDYRMARRRPSMPMDDPEDMERLAELGGRSSRRSGNAPRASITATDDDD